ncbi:hypothetical protein Peur_042359 [Populus x canadensis]
MMTVANSNDSLNLGEWEKQSCKDIAGQPRVQSVESQISQRKMPFYTRFCSFHSLLIIY